MTFSTAELNCFHNFFTVFPPSFSWQRIQVLARNLDDAEVLVTNRGSGEPRSQVGALATNIIVFMKRDTKV